MKQFAIEGNLLRLESKPNPSKNNRKFTEHNIPSSQCIELKSWAEMLWQLYYNLAHI